MRSPRKLLKRALGDLDQLAALLKQFPTAREELVRQIGEPLVDEIARAHEILARAVHRVDSAPSSGDRSDGANGDAAAPEGKDRNPRR